MPIYLVAIIQELNLLKKIVMGVIEYKGDRGTNSVAVSETRNVVLH